MAKVMVAAVLLLAVLLVSDVQGGWVRRTLGRVVDTSRNVIKQEAVTQIKGLVTRVGDRFGVMTGVINKRSANCPPPAAEKGDKPSLAVQLLDELELACPRFSINAETGLSSQVMENAFKESDGNKDGTLSDNELNTFENVVDAFQHCVNMLKAQGK